LSRLIKKAWAVEGDEEKTFETKVYLADPDWMKPIIKF
jgi:hypothetical protein